MLLFGHTHSSTERLFVIFGVNCFYLIQTENPFPNGRMLSLNKTYEFINSLQKLCMIFLSSQVPKGRATIIPVQIQAALPASNRKISVLNITRKQILSLDRDILRNSLEKSVTNFLLLTVSDGLYWR